MAWEATALSCIMAVVLLLANEQDMAGKVKVGPCQPLSDARPDFDGRPPAQTSWQSRVGWWTGVSAGRQTEIGPTARSPSAALTVITRAVTDCSFGCRCTNRGCRGIAARSGATNKNISTHSDWSSSSEEFHMRWLQNVELDTHSCHHDHDGKGQTHCQQTRMPSLGTHRAYPGQPDIPRYHCTVDMCRRQLPTGQRSRHQPSMEGHLACVCGSEI